MDAQNKKKRPFVLETAQVYVPKQTPTQATPTPAQQPVNRKGNETPATVTPQRTRCGCSCGTP